MVIAPRLILLGALPAMFVATGALADGTLPIGDPITSPIFQGSDDGTLPPGDPITSPTYEGDGTLPIGDPITSPTASSETMSSSSDGIGPTHVGLELESLLMAGMRLFFRVLAPTL